MAERGEAGQEWGNWILWDVWGSVTDIGTRYLFICTLVPTWFYASTYRRNRESKTRTGDNKLRLTRTEKERRGKVYHGKWRWFSLKANALHEPDVIFSLWGCLSVLSSKTYLSLMHSLQWRAWIGPLEMMTNKFKLNFFLFFFPSWAAMTYLYNFFLASKLFLTLQDVPGLSHLSLNCLPDVLITLWSISLSAGWMLIWHIQPLKQTIYFETWQCQSIWCIKH